MTNGTRTPGPGQRPGQAHPAWDSVSCEHSPHGDLVHWEVPDVFVPSNHAEPLLIGRVRCDEVDTAGRQTVHDTEVAIRRLDGSLITMLSANDVEDLCTALRSLGGLD